MNPAAAIPMSQEPVRRAVADLSAVVSCTVMLVMYQHLLLPMTDVRPRTPIAPSWRCNKVGQPSVLRGEHASETGRRDGGHRDPGPDEGSVPEHGRRRAAGPLLAGPPARPGRCGGPRAGDVDPGVSVVRGAEGGRSGRPVAEEHPVEEVEDFSLYQTLVEVDPLPYSDTLHLDFLRAFGKDDVREVLMRLPVLYRAPLVLRYMDGFATKEIARMLDTPLGTILARLHRGRKRFEIGMWAYAKETGLLVGEADR